MKETHCRRIPCRDGRPLGAPCAHSGRPLAAPPSALAMHAHSTGREVATPAAYVRIADLNDGSKRSLARRIPCPRRDGLAPSPHAAPATPPARRVLAVHAWSSMALPASEIYGHCRQSTCRARFLNILLSP